MTNNDHEYGLKRISWFECNAEPIGSGTKCNKCGGNSRGECGRTAPPFKLAIH